MRGWGEDGTRSASTGSRRESRIPLDRLSVIGGGLELNGIQSVQWQSKESLPPFPPGDVAASSNRSRSASAAVFSSA